MRGWTARKLTITNTVRLTGKAEKQGKKQIPEMGTREHVGAIIANSEEETIAGEVPTVAERRSLPLRGQVYPDRSYASARVGMGMIEDCVSGIGTSIVEYALI